MNKAHQNALAKESSPYLLQHATNPVDWHPWGSEALDKAAKEDKLLVVSIGYSSCHWCHVMEHESFEDEEVARIMNRYFVSIKIDREERPDIDQVYMSAVHLMGQQGGWPLNCIALPDGRPIWGGTYFQKEQWISILEQIEGYCREKREQALRVAEQVAAGITEHAMISPVEGPVALGKEELKNAIAQWSSNFDLKEGGFGSAPKFPMPVNLDFLLHYAHLEKDRELLDFLELSLEKMARGGIYDQAGGGFARYTVDAAWKVPHFEKMLYDNAQLFALYASAYQVFQRVEFRDVLEQSMGWLEREMRSEEGLFYSALDADSEGEEGKFYTWSEAELKALLGDDFSLFADYYQVNERGYWEDGKYILLRAEDAGSFARKYKLEPEIMAGKIRNWQDTLLEARAMRVRPGLDFKALTAWNSLMISGLVKVRRATGSEKALDLALGAALSVKDLLFENGQVLYRNYARGQASIPGFLDDYAFFMQACLDLYEITMESSWLECAIELHGIVTAKFFDEESGLFFFNAHDTQVLISRQIESQDNVIPSSNAIMGHNLFRLGHLLADAEILLRAENMLSRMRDRVLQYPHGFACWGKLALLQLYPFHEIVIMGKEAPALLRAIAKDYLPQALLAACTQASELPLFLDRYQSGKTNIFVCRDRVCELPVETAEDAKAIYQR